MRPSFRLLKRFGKKKIRNQKFGKATPNETPN